MKNVFISFAIFTIMVLTMFFSLSYLNKVCTRIQQESDKLEELIMDEKWNESYETSKKLLDTWNKYYSIMPIFVNHAELDTLNNEMLRLTQYIKCENKDESLASTHVIKFYLDNVKSLQKINLQNIF